MGPQEFNSRGIYYVVQFISEQILETTLLSNRNQEKHLFSKEEKSCFKKSCSFNTFKIKGKEEQPFSFSKEKSTSRVVMDNFIVKYCILQEKRNRVDYLLFRINSAVLIKVLEVCSLCIWGIKETGISPETFFQYFCIKSLASLSAVFVSFIFSINLFIFFCWFESKAISKQNSVYFQKEDIGFNSFLESKYNACAESVCTVFWLWNKEYFRCNMERCAHA